MPLRVGILLLPDSMLSTVMGPLDVLAAAGSFWPRMVGCNPEPRFTVNLIGIDQKPLSYAGGLSLRPHQDIRGGDTVDIVYVPSLTLMPDQALPAYMDKVSEWLRRQHRGGALLYSVCTGSYVLARAGLLDGLPATTHWAFNRDFQRRFPRVRLQKNAVLVRNEHERLTTGGGGASWHDLVDDLIRHVTTVDIAEEVRSLFLIHNHEVGQGAYSRSLLAPTREDHEVARAQLWLQAHMAEPRPVQQVVAQAMLTGRTLKRRFKKHVGSSIMDYVKMLRIDAAKRLLTRTTTPVEQIAHEVGYQDASFFRRIFRADTGLSPLAFRQRFGRHSPAPGDAEPRLECLLSANARSPEQENSAWMPHPSS